MKRVPNQKPDVLIDVPYLWLNDGYGQTSPLVISLLGEICEAHGLSWGVLQFTKASAHSGEAELSSRIAAHYIHPRDVGGAKLLFRYHYPNTNRLKAEKLVSYTMFETDRCPSGWVDILNQADLVLVPNPYLQGIFSEALSAPVGTLNLPLHEMYYHTLDEKTLVGRLGDTFKFSFVGTASHTDRKGILELSLSFEKAFRQENVQFVLHSRGYKPRFTKITNDAFNVSTSNIIELYLGSHAGVYPSRGEGYGLPQLETSILGRPVIMALNSAAIWSSGLMPWVFTVSCKNGEAKYSHASIGDPGNWGYCDMEQVIAVMKELYNYWAEDKEQYAQSIVKAHHDDLLRKSISHQVIKQQMEEHLLPLIL